MDENLELEVRKFLSEEISTHREFLQSHLKWVTWGIGIIFTVAGILFFYFFGKSYSDTEKLLKTEINKSIIEYKIVEQYKQRLGSLIDDLIKSGDTKEEINALVAQSANSYITASIDSVLSKVIDSKLKQLEISGEENFSKILERASIPQKVVLPFNLEVCPSGWSVFEAGRGRFLVGAGKGLGLPIKRMGETGGSETHTLTIREMPKHSHEIPRSGDNVNDNYFKGEGSYARKGQISLVAGDSQPHNNMPPYISLLFCEKI